MNFIKRFLGSSQTAPPISDDKFYIIQGSHGKHVVTNELIEFFEKRSNSEGFLYTGYPVLGTVDGAFAIDALLVSKHHGLVAFDIVESDDLGDYQTRQDEIYNRLYAYLLDYDSLINRRNLIVNITIVTVAPRGGRKDIGGDFPIVKNITDLEAILEQAKWQNNSAYEQLHSVIQNITSIRKNRNKRRTNKDNSRGALLKKLEDSIANLDHSQANAVINTYEGVQRIRGLAGSGKTIVLALKVAYLHTMNPDWDIAVTFNTRSLKKQFETLITRFVHERTREEPDWSKIEIIHAWGARGDKDNSGIYYNFCKDHGEEYLDFNQAKNRYGYEDAFSHVCKVALDNQSGKVKPKYDAIFVDEAQDFSFDDNSSYFLKMCYQLLRQPKRLIYAYDELQSLSMRSVPNPDELFGQKEGGKPEVGADEYSDVLLFKCYRNSRPILSSAHALGFGTYYEHGLIQMFKNSSIWGDVGYYADSGSIVKGNEVVLERRSDSSPKFLEELAPKDDLIEFRAFSNNEEQINFLVDDIIRNIEEEELLPSDIIVVNPNPLTTRDAVAKARKILFDKGYNSTLAGVTSSPDVFQEDNAITFTGIYRAKGNEAGMVYILNGQYCYSGSSLAKKRNILFTAMTRSKAWVRVIGYGEAMESLCKEYEMIKDNDYKLKFMYPTDQEMQKMNLINRDLDPQSEKQLDKLNQDFAGFIDAVERGDLGWSDLDPKVVEKIKAAMKVDEQ